MEIDGLEQQVVGLKVLIKGLQGQNKDLKIALNLAREKIQRLEKLDKHVDS
jgi:hypothetical protein